MVTAPSPIQHTFCGQHATTSRQQYSNECDEIANLPKLSTVSVLSNVSTGSLGGLKRTVSSLQSAKPCLLADPATECIVEAKQVEMDFATLTNCSFYLTIKAPNGEISERIHFPKYGHSTHYTPQRNGCGHGNWVFVVERRNPEQKSKLRLEHEQKIYLDGVGTLFFTIDDDLHVRLSSQEFLRLPSASQCCSKKNKSLRK